VYHFIIVSLFRWSCCTSSSLALLLQREISFRLAIVMDLMMRQHGGVVLLILFLNNSPSSVRLSCPLLTSAISPPLSSVDNRPVMSAVSRTADTSAMQTLIWSNSSANPFCLPSISVVSLSSSSSSLSSSSLPSILWGNLPWSLLCRNAQSRSCFLRRGA
jgi:hypothetical protein